MDKPKDYRPQQDYGEWLEEHKDEVLHSALAAIDPSQLQYDEFIALGGAMKALGLQLEEWDAIARKDLTRYKGTLAKKWNGLKGSGKHGQAGEGTIYDLAKRCGWTWPAPDQTAPAKPKQQPKPAPQDLLTVTWDEKHDFRLSCLMDSHEYTSKPVNVWEIRSREAVPTPEPEQLTLEDFARAVTKGRTFYPTVYSKELKGYRADGKPDYYYRPISQQIFVVDIDNEISEGGKKHRIDKPLTIAAALDICKQKGVQPFLIYETFSSKDHRNDPEEPYTKFRICFATTEPVTVQKYGERGIDAAINYFINLFGQAADSKTTDYARLIYGTDERDSARLWRNALSANKLMEQVFKPDLPEAGADPDQTEQPAEQLQPVGGFIDLFKTHRQEFKQNIRTGFTNLDIALGGGFGNELYIMGAETGTGKSAIASVLAQNIAASGIDVLYYALEMGRDEFIARGASAISAELAFRPSSGREPIKYSEILNDTYDYAAKNFFRRPYSQYEEYVQEYARRYGEHLYIIEGGLNGRTARSIADAVNKFKEDHNVKQLAVFIDYLQLLSADPNDKSQRDFMNIMSAAVKILKALASQAGATVFLISSMANDKKGKNVNDASFKYSGDIGYTGGVLLGWNWKGVTNNSKDRDALIAEAKKTGTRHMVLEILKHRSGERDSKIRMQYKPAYNYIVEDAFYTKNEDFMPARSDIMDLLKKAK